MISWVVEHLLSILQWIGGIVSCSSIIVKLTPTTKDDGVVDNVIKVLDHFSIYNTKKDAAILKDAKE